MHTLFERISDGNWGMINYVWLFVLPRSFEFVRGFRMSYLEPWGFLMPNIKLRVLKIPFFLILVMRLIMPYLERRLFKMSCFEHVGFGISYYWTCGIPNILVLNVWDSEYLNIERVRFGISYYWTCGIPNILVLNVWDSEYLIIERVGFGISYYWTVGFRIS